MKMLKLVGVLLIIILFTGCPNPHPYADDDFIFTNINESIVIPVLENDGNVYNPEALDISLFTEPENGTVTFNPDNYTFTYTPNQDYVGNDTFVYEIYRKDYKGEVKSQATVTITVKDGNIPPVAVNDYLRILKNTKGRINILNNDINEDDGINFVTLISVGNPSHGKVNHTGGLITYEPDNDFVGDDYFNYIISDGYDISVGFVYIEVKASNTKPVANDDYVTAKVGESIVVDVILNDEDKDNDELYIEYFSSGRMGTLDLVDGKIVYTPSSSYIGQIEFYYIVSDGLEKDSAYVYITIEDK